jgi:hypothetical protein
MRRWVRPFALVLLVEVRRDSCGIPHITVAVQEVP